MGEDYEVLGLEQ